MSENPEYWKQVADMYRSSLEEAYVNLARLERQLALALVNYPKEERP